MKSAKSQCGAWIVWALPLLLLAAALWWWQTREQQIRQVDTETVSRGSVSHQLLATGHVVNARQMTITALLPGRITAVNARAGDPVKAGEVLIELDQETMLNALEDAKLERSLARLQLSNDTRLHKLNTQMHHKSVISDDTMQQSEYMRSRSKLLLKKAENRVQKVQLQTANTRIHAPFNALVIENLADLGQWVDEGTPLLELAAADENRIEVKLDASDAANISVGMPVQMRSDAYPDSRWAERVDWRSTAVHDDDENRFIIHLSLGKDAPPLLLGQRVEADLQLNHRDQVLRLPVQHLRYREQQAGVWLLDGQRLRWQAVETGLQNDRWIELTAGVEEFDRVLAAGEALPPPGQHVRGRGDE